jgi:hypothetical protein
MGKADDLLRGAVDMHFHGYPEISLDAPHRYRDEESAQLMMKAGMRGFVLKSHFWPTMAPVDALRSIVPGLEIFASITLNPCVGGFQPWVLEAAVKQGARVVFLPTWSARNDLQRNGVIHLLRKYLPSLEGFTENEGITLIDERGELVPEVRRLLSGIHAYDLALFTGHVSIRESLALAREAGRIGFQKLVLDHPDSRSVGAAFEEIVEFARLGGYVEICALGLMPLFQRIAPQDFKKIIRAVGAHRCILTSDSFFEWAPSGPEMLRMLIAALLEVGVREEEIILMNQVNPKRLLGIP